MTRRHGLPWGLAWSAIASAACARPAVAPPAVTTRDSLGVTIIESAAPAWVADSGWKVDPTPLLRVPYESPFTVRLRRATRLSDGRLALLSAATNQIAIYDTTGRLVRTFGGQGEGPGEFRTAERMQRLA